MAGRWVVPRSAGRRAVEAYARAAVAWSDRWLAKRCVCPRPLRERRDGVHESRDAQNRSGFSQPQYRERIEVVNLLHISVGCAQLVERADRVLRPGIAEEIGEWRDTVGAEQICTGVEYWRPGNRCVACCQSER